jgi:putative oxidoreductase
MLVLYGHRRASDLFSFFVSFLIRVTLVALFLPFSALDKLLNTDAAVKQAQGTVHSRVLSQVLVGAGLFVELVMSLAVLTGFFDRLAAVILAGYCVVTAVLWKQFWKKDDFRLKGPSKGRDVFWDFLKNFALAGGFLVLATGGTAYGVTHLILHPLSSSHPYSSAPLDLHAPDADATNPPAGVSR